MLWLTGLLPDSLGAFLVDKIGVANDVRRIGVEFRPKTRKPAPNGSGPANHLLEQRLSESLRQASRSQSRSRSLIDVLARVRSSTRFTITAQ
jgi:hypothetical protein